MDKLTRVDFSTLPLQDAVQVIRGNGKRKIAIFQDPNCGYCKQIEQDFKDVTDVSIYVFMYPILGKDSVQKSNNLWCAADRGVAWEDWMLHGNIAKTAKPDCDLTAIERNLKLGRDLSINGTPAVIFENGFRIAGAISVKDLESQFASISSK